MRQEEKLRPVGYVVFSGVEQDLGRELTVRTDILKRAEDWKCPSALLFRPVLLRGR